MTGYAKANHLQLRTPMSQIKRCALDQIKSVNREVESHEHYRHDDEPTGAVAKHALAEKSRAIALV